MTPRSQITFISVFLLVYGRKVIGKAVTPAPRRSEEGWNVMWKRITENFDDAVRRAGADPRIAVRLTRLVSETPTSTIFATSANSATSAALMFRSLGSASNDDCMNHEASYR